MRKTINLVLRTEEMSENGFQRISEDIVVVGLRMEASKELMDLAYDFGNEKVNQLITESFAVTVEEGIKNALPEVKEKLIGYLKGNL